jgi:hypothetical protein
VGGPCEAPSLYAINQLAVLSVRLGVGLATLLRAVRCKTKKLRRNAFQFTCTTSAGAHVNRCALPKLTISTGSDVTHPSLNHCHHEIYSNNACIRLPHYAYLRVEPHDHELLKRSLAHVNTVHPGHFDIRLPAIFHVFAVESPASRSNSASRHRHRASPVNRNASTHTHSKEGGGPT